MDTTTAAELVFVVSDVPQNSGTALAEEPDDMLIDIRPDTLPPAHVPANLSPALVYLAGLLSTAAPRCVATWTPPPVG